MLVEELEYAPTDEGIPGNLATLIRRAYKKDSHLPIDDALRFAREIADGLAALHKILVVHRDIKPSNILIGADGKAKVADLGLAQTKQSRLSGGSTELKRDHPGTNEYKPNEQLPGKYMPLKPSADVYALGCVLFELLTGDLYYNQRHGTRAKTLRPDVPSDVDDLLARMLADDAEQRPLNGAEAVQLLGACADAWRVANDTKLASESVKEEDRERQRKLDEERKEKERRKELARQEEERRRREFLVRLWQSLKKLAPIALVLAVLVVVGFGAVAVLVAGLSVRNANSTRTAIAFASQPTSTPSSTPTKTPTPTPTISPGSTQILKLDGMVQVYVPAGPFTMGVDDPGWFGNNASHTVTLAAFWIDKTEVTNAMYVLCVKAGDCLLPKQESSSTRRSYYGTLQYDNYPVINITWVNANAYCSWAKRRLPSEAEWEKAARGIDGRIFPWGNQFDSAKLNYALQVGDTTEVGKYPSGVSPYGAFDMAGNVWEWVADWYDGNYYSNSPSQNPTGPSSGKSRVLRGGSWTTGVARRIIIGLAALGDNNGLYARATYRDELEPSDFNVNVGFRCASSP